ncbi:MAG: hypothetical protein K2N74_01080 [Clostridiales bacterium]|nr:hypothetical protein [Clostridiales bacterium]
MRETKTVQVYPSDAKVNAAIAEYGSFGWEVISNQRCQEYTGQTRNSDGGSTEHYSTFNKITFSREKDVPWYGKVTQLEDEYFAAQDKIEHYEYLEPELRYPKRRRILVLILFILSMLVTAFLVQYVGREMNTWIRTLLQVLEIVVYFVVYLIIRACIKAKYRKEYQKALSRYRAKYPAKIEALKKRKAELRACAERCIYAQA